MTEPETSHRTRSKAAPDWTADETLTLATEINTVESDWGSTLPSFQKWQQIVENCNALGVNRNLNQCKQKWEALLAEYRLAKNRGGRANASFPDELFDAIDVFVGGGRDKSGGEEEEERVVGTDPDSDPDVKVGLFDQLSLETGPKKQRRRMKRKKREVEKLNPWGYSTSTNIKQEEPSKVKAKPGILKKSIAKSIPDETTSVAEKEQQMATILWENALEINTILETNPVNDELGDKLTDLSQADIVQTRCQGDKLIDYLTKISITLNQLCNVAQNCNGS